MKYNDEEFELSDEPGNNEQLDFECSFCEKDFTSEIKLFKLMWVNI